MLSSILAGRTTVHVEGIASASTHPTDFLIGSRSSDVANFARRGKDLIVEMKDGKVHTIHDFGALGWDYNSLVFTGGPQNIRVDFTQAISSTGDGIVEALVTGEIIGAGISQTALLGILGATAAGGGALALASGGGGDAAPPTNPTIPADPNGPDDPGNPTSPGDPDPSDPLVTPYGFAISPDTGQSPNDGITSQNRLVFSGSAEPNTIVEVFLDNISVGSTTTDSQGNWELNLSGNALPDGSYTVTLQATDSDGNKSPVSTGVPLVIDTSEPSKPANLGITHDGTSTVEGVSSHNELVFTGTAEPFSTVEVFIDGISIGTVPTDAEGNWALDHTGHQLADGSYEITAIATDAAGNASPTSSVFPIVVDSTNPSVTIIGNGGAGGLITFTFSSIIDAATFTESDITAVNGTVNPGSLTQINPTTWQAYVTADPGATTNVAITLAAGAVQSAYSRFNNLEGKNATTLDDLFKNSVPLGANPAGMDTSHAISAFSTFGSNATFNGDISGWNVSNVTDMTRMFYLATMFNQNIGAWDTHSVTNMSGMFSGALAFNQNLSGWNVSNVTDMSNMFGGALAFNQHIGGWDTSSVTTMRGMFEDTSFFNQDLAGWDVSQVTSMQNMFNGAVAFNRDLSAWNFGNVTTMQGMFANTSAFNQDLSGWNVSNVQDMSQMFENAIAFNQDLGGWNISSLINAADMFTQSGISVANMDATLRGWARLDAGETIQNNVDLGVATYTDATAVQRLTHTKGWSITGTLAADVVVGSSGNDSLGSPIATADQIIHGLDGNDSITGGSGHDWIVGGRGIDILEGGAGSDTFHYGFSDAGADIITDFENIAGGDVLHLADLLIGYTQGASALSSYVTATSDGSGGTIITVDHNADGAATDLVSIRLLGIGYSTSLLDDMISQGNLVVT